jgi:hypothetical protein
MYLKSLTRAFLCIASLMLSNVAIAQSPSKDWNGNYNFSGPGGNSSRLLQADLIERKDNGYYDSFGPGNLTVNNFLTNTVGTLNSYTTTIDGEGNSVVNDSTAYNYGNLNGSINVISNSLLNTTETSSNTISSTNEFID